MFFSRAEGDEAHLRAQWGQPRSRERRFDLIDLVAKKEEAAPGNQRLSDRTLGDLDFPKLFAYLDRTTSAVGRQRLYSKLRDLPEAPDFGAQEARVDAFEADARLRLKAQSALARLDDDRASYVALLFLDPLVEAPASLSMMKALSVMSLVAVLGCALSPKLILVALSFFVFHLALHYANKKYIDMYSTSIPQLSLLCRCAQELKEAGLPAALVAEVEAPLASLLKLRRRMAVFTLEANQSTDMLVGLAHLVAEYVKIQLLLEPILVFGVLDALREKQGDVRRLWAWVADLDVALSVASLRHGPAPTCLPDLTAPSGIAFTDLTHPLVPGCVPNTLTATEPSVLLTGSNMSGKTTFIRAVGISAWTAQTLNTAFAAAFTLAPARLYTGIRISDDVLSGKSYYFEEVLTIGEIVAASQAPGRCLILLDELFKGTNTVERIAAGKAVLSYIAGARSTVFVSTHDVELTHLLTGAYDLYHFTELVKDGEVHFDYTLKPGELTTRNAIRILEINGYPEEVIEEARALARGMVGGEGGEGGHASEPPGREAGGAGEIAAPDA